MSTNFTFKQGSEDNKKKGELPANNFHLKSCYNFPCFISEDSVNYFSCLSFSKSLLYFMSR